MELSQQEVVALGIGGVIFVGLAVWFVRRGWFGALTGIAAFLILAVFLLKYGLEPR